MKLNDVKHNHSLTDLLKVLLFSIIMLLPFIDVAVKCGYVMFNKNAYQSYSNYTETKTTNVSLSTTLINGQVYTINPLSYTTQMNQSVNYEVYDNQTNAKEIYFPNDNFQVIKITLATSSERTRLILIDENNTQHNAFNIETPFYFKSNGINDTTTQNVWYTITTLSYTTGKLDNVFEYSVSQLEESQLYNWTTQTAIYSGVSQMTTQLGITTNIIPIIVCYWFFITIIYIILDIVIRLFTMLTHAIGSKTA